MKIECPACDGRGSVTFLAYTRFADGTGGHQHRTSTCRICGGSGETNQATAERISKGRRMAEDRKARMLSIREEAERLGITARELGDIEWGRGDPAFYGQAEESPRSTGT